MSFDVLQDKIRAMKNPTVAGLDPKLEYVPPFIVEEKMKQYGQTLRCAAEAFTPTTWADRRAVRRGARRQAPECLL